LWLLHLLLLLLLLHHHLLLLLLLHLALLLLLQLLVALLLSAAATGLWLGRGEGLLVVVLGLGALGVGLEVRLVLLNLLGGLGAAGCAAATVFLHLGLWRRHCDNRLSCWMLLCVDETGSDDGRLKLLCDSCTGVKVEESSGELKFHR
jgi:hypothetical protein